MYLRRLHVPAFVLLLAFVVAVQADNVDDYVKAQMERHVHCQGFAHNWRDL